MRKEGDNHRQKRAKRMLPAIAALISGMAQSSENRETLAPKIIAKIKTDFPQEIPPTLETVLQRISKARNQETPPEDQPWHMGSLDDHPLPAESIAYVLAVERLALTEGWPGITIRQAKWVSRLYAVKALQQSDSLLRVSRAYAMYERSWEVARLPKPCDTARLDRSLSDGTWERVIADWDEDVDFAVFKRAFEDTMKVPLAGVMVPVKVFYVAGDKVFALIAEGKDRYDHVPLPVNKDELIKDLKKRRLVKKMRKNPQEGISLAIALKRPIRLKIPADRLLPPNHKNGGTT